MNNDQYLQLEITNELADLAESYEKKVAVALYDNLTKYAPTYGFLTNNLLSYSGGTLDFYKDFLRYVIKSKPGFMTRQAQKNNHVETNYKKFHYNYSKKYKQLKEPIEYSIDGGQTWQILSQDRQDLIGALRNNQKVKSIERLGNIVFEEIGEEIIFSQVKNAPLDQAFNQATTKASKSWEWDTTLGLVFKISSIGLGKLAPGAYVDAIKLDHKANLNRFHFGTETYDVRQLLDDSMVELAENMIRSRIKNIWPVYYSIHSGEVLLTSEMLRKGKFYWKGLNESVQIQAQDLARYIEETELNGASFYDKFMRQAEEEGGVFLRNSYSGGSGFKEVLKRAIAKDSAKMELWYVRK